MFAAQTFSQVLRREVYRRKSCDHFGEKSCIRIQNQFLMYTQEETRTWHILGSWICEFKASGPASYSAMHSFPLAGRSGMPKYCLIHLRGLFSMTSSPSSYTREQTGHTNTGWRETATIHVKVYLRCRVLDMFCSQPWAFTGSVQSNPASLATKHQGVFDLCHSVSSPIKLLNDQDRRFLD